VTGRPLPGPERTGDSSRLFKRTPEKTRVSIGTACVLGGSFAGLLAARVLADHAERVLVLERDAPTADASVRPSVPQGKHGHLLQPEGLTLIEDWFPGFTQDARARGAVLAPPGHQRLFTDGVAVELPPATMLMGSRPFLENEIRRRVKAIPNVQIVQARVTGLRCGAGAVRAVVHRPRGDGESGTERVFDADITVDAMGRSSRLSNWLVESGFAAPAVHRVPVGISYATALFRRPEDPREPDVPVALGQFTSPPPVARSLSAGGAGLAAIGIYAVEGSLWQVVTMAYERDRAQTTAEGLRALSADLPEVFREATHGDPVGEVATYYYRESLRRSVTDPENFPAGLFGIGDSVASFNPIHGQGLVSAAGQVSVLAAHLAASDDPAGQSRAFIQDSEKAIDETWKAGAGV
jgi:2-polyprenyl-6-methoxyphenol hydroxylase-like FAD-dependent oxidoreductase